MKCLRFAHIKWTAHCRSFLYLGALLGLVFPLSSCQSQSATQSEQAADGTGELVVRANGEDFIRQGFTDKDGWEMSFDHAYVTLSNVAVLQTDPMFEPGTDKAPQVKAQVESDRTTTVDLAASPEDEPVVIEFADAPAGRYNALAWELIPATTDESAGYSVALMGTATKAGEQIAFEIGLEDAIAFTCGDYIGEARKGILSKDETAEVEATFHFDHLFGDGEAAADDEINTGALGFEPLAALAENGELSVDSEMLKNQLSQEDYETLQNILPNLGHVGEGHCESITLAQ